MPPEGVAFVAAITVVGCFLLLLPVVRALSDRIRGRGAAGTHEELQNLRDELNREIEELRQSGAHVDELSERVDFLERLAAKQREAERLPPAR
ncbi:MAG TPA: hypothetical protein VH439_10900 [Gemmatimonadales bacterium]|jgi:hypothetical protein